MTEKPVLEDDNDLNSEGWKSGIFRKRTRFHRDAETERRADGRRQTGAGYQGQRGPPVVRGATYIAHDRRKFTPVRKELREETGISSSVWQLLPLATGGTPKKKQWTYIAHDRRKFAPVDSWPIGHTNIAKLSLMSNNVVAH